MGATVGHAANADVQLQDSNVGVTARLVHKNTEAFAAKGLGVLFVDIVPGALYTSIHYGHEV